MKIYNRKEIKHMHLYRLDSCYILALDLNGTKEIIANGTEDECRTRFQEIVMVYNYVKLCKEEAKRGRW